MPTLRLPQGDPARPVRRPIIPGGEALVAREAQRAAGVAQDIFNVVVGQEIREQEKEAAKAARDQELDERKETATQLAVAEAEFGETVAGFAKRLETASDAELAPDAVTGMFESARDASGSGIDDPAAQADFERLTRIEEPGIRAQVDALIRAERGKRQLVRFDRARSQLWSGATIEDFANRIDAIPAFLARFRDVYDSKFLNDKRQETETEIAVTAAQDGLITRPFDTAQLIDDGLFDPFMSAKGAASLRNQMRRVVSDKTIGTFDVNTAESLKGQDPRVTQENHGAAAQGDAVVELGSDDLIKKILQADRLLDQPIVQKSLDDKTMNQLRFRGIQTMANVIDLETSITFGRDVRGGRRKSFGPLDPESVKGINNFDKRDKKIELIYNDVLEEIGQIQSDKVLEALGKPIVGDEPPGQRLRDLSPGATALLVARHRQAGFFSTTDAKFIRKIWGRNDESGLSLGTLILGGALETMGSASVATSDKAKFTTSLTSILGKDGMAQVQMGWDLGGDGRAVLTAREIAIDRNRTDSAEKRWLVDIGRAPDHEKSMESLVGELVADVAGSASVGGDLMIEMTERIHSAYLANGQQFESAVKTAFDAEVEEESWGNVNGVFMRGAPAKLGDWAVEHLTMEIEAELGKEYKDVLPIRVGAPLMPNAPRGFDPKKTYVIMDPKTNRFFNKRDGTLFFVQVNHKETNTFRRDQNKSDAMVVDRFQEEGKRMSMSRIQGELGQLAELALRSVEQKLLFGSDQDPKELAQKTNLLQDAKHILTQLEHDTKTGEISPNQAQKTIDSLIKQLQSAGVKIPNVERMELHSLAKPPKG